MSSNGHTYDVAMSFAGAQRAYVERVVRACEALGVRVFYDENETVALWGRNVVVQLRQIYGGYATRYVIPFLSEEYLAGKYPMDELMAAIATGLEREDGYILPVLMDDVEVPRELLNPGILYLRSADFSPEQLAEVIAQKVGAAAHHDAPNNGGLIASAPQVRMPRIPPTSFSQQDTLEAVLVRVGELFQQTSGALDRYGYACRVRATESAVGVRIEERGAPIYELRLGRGDSMWGEKLTLSFGWPRIVNSGINGWVSVEWDPDTAQPRLNLEDMSAGTPKPLATADDLFAALWEKILRFIEHR